MIRKTRSSQISIFTRLATVCACALGLASLLAPMSPASAGGTQAAAPPAEVQKLLDGLAGNWSAKDIIGQLKGKPTRSDSHVQCEKVAAGWGLRCGVQVLTAGRSMELAQILSWDKPTGEFHLFSVNDTGDSHDHRGSFDGTTLALEYKSTRDGKALVEHLSLTLRGPRQLLWKNSCVVGTEVVFSGEGVYQK
jgi:hypothetical protein